MHIDPDQWPHVMINRRKAIKTLNYDLIIVGGGPAGAVTALYAARHGLRVLLLDNSYFPRNKICGDAIGGKAISILRDLQLENAILEFSRVRFRKVLFGSARHIEVEIDLDRARKRDFATGYVIRRRVFGRVSRLIARETRRMSSKALR